MATPGVEQKNPQVTPEVTNFAVSTATARSHCATSWQPAAAAAPCTFAITGCGRPWMDIIIALHLANSVGDLRLLAQLADFLQVVAGAEALAGGREDHDAYVLVLLDRIESSPAAPPAFREVSRFICAGRFRVSVAMPSRSSRSRTGCCG